MNEHEHEWYWQWFGEEHAPEAALVGLRTCGCGAFERVHPSLGYTPVVAARIQAGEASRESNRVRQREYAARKRAAGG